LDSQPSGALTVLVEGGFTGILLGKLSTDGLGCFRSSLDLCQLA